MPGAQRLIAGRYRLQRPLADGGFGRVWHAHDESLDADVVVKEVRLPLTADPHEHARRLKYAEREARNAAKLRHHPGIVPVYDVAIEDDKPWIVMELVDGGTLENRFSKGRLPPDEAAEVAETLLKALDAAHQAGIVHRDVKPANIMLAGDGRVLLTDFGIASHQADTRLTTDGGIIGTLEYLAPERLNGAAAAPTSDLFSLGVTLFRAVEGTSPFLRDSQAATLAALAMEEPPPLEHAGQLAPLIRGLLAKDPGARLTVTDALVLLRNRHLTPEPVSQSQPPAMKPQPPASEGPFEMAWTGNEPLDSYTDKAPVHSWRAIRGWSVAMAGVAVPFLILALTLQPVHRPNGAGDDFSARIACGCCAIALTVVAGLLALWASNVRRDVQLPEVIPGWTLHVGKNYIVTTSTAGRREFTWDRIKNVTVKQIPHRGPYKFTGLILELDLKLIPSISTPAGWPHPHVRSSFIDGLRLGEVAVCVLGPMTHQQRTEMSEALARYGGWRWQPLERAVTAIGEVIRRRVRP